MADGALLGLGLGAALGALNSDTADDNYQGDNPFCGMGFFDDCTKGGGARYVVVGAGMGMLMGLALDSIIYSRERAIYRGTARITVSPWLDGGTRGMVASVWKQ